uniref:Uncharacterized protein n=1 Tax=Romanomermis culicivorax TaxID=13658 RepID=A0A915L7Y4_ROMCU
MKIWDADYLKTISTIAGGSDDTTFVMAVGFSFCLGSKIDHVSIGNWRYEVASKVVKRQKVAIGQQWFWFEDI